MPIIGNNSSAGKKPTTPTIGTAVDGGTGTTVNVPFTASTYIGKDTITYTALSNPGSISATSSGSPINITGLTTGTAYTFTVTGNTNYGVESAASAASNSVTPAVPSGFFSIASAAPTGVSTVTFSSIPSTYTHLQIRANFKHNSSNQGFLVQYNGVTTGTAYSWIAYETAGAGQPVGSNQSYSNIRPMGLNYGTGSLGGEAWVYDIYNYASTTKTKSSLSRAGNYYDGASRHLALSTGNYNSLSAISSVTITSTDTFTAGTSIALYGIL